MRASVLQAFPGFTAGFEGRLPFMYTDNKGLVTTGVGNLIDPIAAALVLPWKRSDGNDASQDEISAEWHKVKDAYPAVQSTADRSLATLHLEPADIDRLVASKAKSNEDVIRGQLPGYDSWPADAQLAILSMAWAQGPSFHSWPHLLVALGASTPDFLAAAGNPGNASSDTGARGQAWLNDVGNPGLRPRNLANKVLFQNAARVQVAGGDYERLWYPTEVAEGAVPSGGGGWKTVGEIALFLLLVGGGAAALAAFTPQGRAWWAMSGRPWIARTRRWAHEHEPGWLRKDLPL
mgnify:CR=1 FL=1